MNWIIRLQELRAVVPIGKFNRICPRHQHVIVAPDDQEMAINLTHRFTWITMGSRIEPKIDDSPRDTVEIGLRVDPVIHIDVFGKHLSPAIGRDARVHLARQTAFVQRPVRANCHYPFNRDVFGCCQAKGNHAAIAMANQCDGARIEVTQNRCHLLVVASTCEFFRSERRLALTSAVDSHQAKIHAEVR